MNIKRKLKAGVLAATCVLVLNVTEAQASDSDMIAKILSLLRENSERLKYNTRLLKENSDRLEDNTRKMSENTEKLKTNKLCPISPM